MPRINQLMFVCSAVGMLACGQDSLTDPTAVVGAAPELARATPVSRPAGGTCETRIEVQSPDVIVIELDCNLQHLGRTSGISTQTITVTGATPEGKPIVSLSSSPVYTAANGDVLNASFSGTGIIDPQAGTVTFSGMETYAGGTGRFEGATGSVALTGNASLGSNTGHYEVVGSITY